MKFENENAYRSTVLGISKALDIQNVLPLQLTTVELYKILIIQATAVLLNEVWFGVLTGLPGQNCV